MPRPSSISVPARAKTRFHALLCGLLDVPPHGDAAMRHDAFAQALAQQRAGRDHALYLADLLVVRHEADGVYDAMDNDARQRGKREALADVVERAAAQAPCVLLVEDVHWASPWVLACLQTIAASAERHPIVLLMTTRREGAALATPWPAERTTRFDLAPLAAKEALALARIHFATSPDLAQRCVDRAQGNPLFLVQLLRSGTDDDAVPGVDPERRAGASGPSSARRQARNAGRGGDRAALRSRRAARADRRCRLRRDGTDRAGPRACGRTRAGRARVRACADSRRRVCVAAA
jgi:hypothetical protein